MKINYDLTKVLEKKHEKNWVALSKDQTRVVDFSSNLVELRDRIGRDNMEVVYMKVLPSDMEFAF